MIIENDIPAESENLGEIEQIAVALACTVDDVRELARQFKREPSELPDLLGSLKWSADKVLKFGAALAPTYLSVKVQFNNSKKNGMSGAFCLLADGRNGKIIDESYAVSPSPLALSPSVPWEGFRQKVLASHNSDDRTDIPRLHKIANSVFTPAVLRDIFSMQKKSLPQETQEKLIKLIAGNYEGADIYPVAYERFSAARMKLGGFDAKYPEIEAPKAADFVKPEILCRAVVDPLHGKAFYDLDKNDRIWVQLADGPGINGIVFRLFEYLQADPIFPVESIEELPTGIVALRFSITDEIMGVVNVMHDLRIKVFNPETKSGHSVYWFAVIAFVLGVALTFAIGYFTN